jgi:hypothetical protein
MLAQPDAGIGVNEKLHQGITSARPRLAAQIATIKLQHIEGVQEGFGRALAGEADAHGIEVGLPISTTYDALTVEHYRAHGQVQKGVSNGGKPLAPIMAAARVDAHLLALADGEEAEAVVLNLIGLLRPGRHCAANGRQARLDKVHADHYRAMGSRV